MSHDPFSYANLANLELIEGLYRQYQQDPNSVEASWRAFFDGMALGALITPQASSTSLSVDGTSPDLRIYRLIDAYRMFGHQMASFNPIATAVINEPVELQLQTLGFSQEELKSSFPTCGILNEKTAPLETIIAALKKTYCGLIGVEYMGLGFHDLEKWIQSQIEPFFPLKMDPEKKLAILHQLNRSELFESFLHTKYVGQKRFSLEGAETLIPLLSALVEKGADLGVQEAVLGMSHRGRLNVLANIVNKSYAQIFHEFEDVYIPEQGEGSGDVKYHKGFTGSLQTQKKQTVNITLAANPSHLESVDPVVEGIARGKQESLKRAAVVPILIHGDAAVAGQGVVYETLQLSGLRGYATGGTIHIVVNNQIGFTTLPKDSRSTAYCTEIARTFRSPVFHVNAEDPEGCARVAELAIEIRNRFGTDVFIDLNCYRKYGHNEGDEPTFTQPLEYSLIKKKKSIRTLFTEQLIREKVIDQKKAEELEAQFKESLHKELDLVTQLKKEKEERVIEARHEVALSGVATDLALDQIVEVGKKICSYPENLQCHPKVARLMQERLAMVTSDPSKAVIDWPMAESLALATLLQQKVHIRLTGQDVRRGTFSQRHAMLVDQVSSAEYFPLSHISPDQAAFHVYNSPLSEYAALGFEFGYSITYPKSLVIWEAQYGDFANEAQVVIDQYIASSEQKWDVASSLTLMLPHGYEGQGPEHSSARIERFLQLSGHNNMRIVNCTTPAQIFHVLRAQALNPAKKPLILFTPKALLRHPECHSNLDALAKGHFEEVLKDPESPQNAKRLLLCSGKIFYDLVQERKTRQASDTAIVRVEELYPFPSAELKEIQAFYKEITTICWVQEEHQNMGPWEYIYPQLQQLFEKIPIQFAGRERSAAPATGSHALHKKQHTEIMNQAFKGKS